MRGVLRLLLFALFAVASDGLKFLVFNPRIGRSHTMQMGKLADQLAAAGHDVVNFQPLVYPLATTGVSHKSVRTIEFKAKNVTILQTSAMTTGVWLDDMFKFQGIGTAIRALGNNYLDYCLEAISDNELMESFKKEKFDLIISEFFSACGAVLGEKLGISKSILVSGMPLQLDLTGLYGIPSTPSFVPDSIHTHGVNGFFERINSLIGFVKTSIFTENLVNLQAEALEKVETKRTFNEILASASYVWVNTDEFVDFPRPISHKYVNIGGLGMKESLKKAGKLPEEIENIYKRAKKGVVFMSFGSVAQSKFMPDANKKAILEAFSQLPEVEFIWKYENLTEELPGPIPSNVYLSNWLPQRDILLHPKTLAFITHGGMNSITEATWSGVPMICIPLFGDQARNGAMIKRKKVAEVLSKFDLNKKDVIIETVRKFINDKHYKEQAVKLAEIIRNKPISPEERVVQTAEFAAKYDVEEHLDMDGRKLSTIQFYNLDIIFAIISTAILVVVIGFFALRRAYITLSGILGFSKQKRE
ncbi:unnamed protein product [Bursaphelenchus xylophilus]|uniref:glucuronosyltransferase n=1 Tax=Bursaphelenchus xylophilus TaxID=6326 RepID=A0A1I7SCI4_BURXY|nr:unnamed protein product [Bursaphelenchus xylophilus]CAG9094046.1 unnamed protein product [Bursaphelenchus xylophilus]